MCKQVSRCALAICLAVFVIPKNAEASIFGSTAALEASVGFAEDMVFDPVGLLVGTDGNGDSFAAGTGVLVDPYWVLTAGHVPFDEGTTLFDSMRFSTSSDTLSNLDSFIEADLLIPFPGHSRDVPAGQGDDLALIRLSQPILDVDPVVRFYGQDVEGTDFITAGYGNPGVWPNEGTFDGIRRGGQNSADTFGRNFGVSSIEEQFWVADLDLSASDNPFPLEWQASNVDSGSPWLSTFNDDVLLIGISSAGLATNDISAAIRTSLYNDWIDSTIEAHSVPEPANVCSFLVGVLTLTSLRLGIAVAPKSK